MEEKVSVVLKLIQEDGDSFAKRAEMYYKKRPELISFVEESFRAYRALAERYDHISKELQSANNTLASAFPDQFQYMMDEDDDESSLPFPRRGMKSASKNAKIPEAPKNFPTRNIKAIMALAANKGGGDKPETPPKRSAGSKQKKKTKTVPESGLTESQAIKEIDKLQKTILTRQTEKEFYKSNYEKGVAKYRLIEQDITQMQEKISKLQDEFGVRKAIEDDEARTLMAQAALKSCQEKLAELQRQQEKSAKEAKIEREKVKQARDRLLSLRRCVDGGQEDGEVHNNQSQPLTAVEREQEPNSSDAADKVKELEMLRDKIKERFMADSTMSVTEMAEKINELVKKAINLETSVASQSALIQRLKLEAGDLQGQVQTLGCPSIDRVKVKLIH